MAISDNRALLPAGLRDVLAPDAAHEAAIVERLLAAFAGWGYRRVKPPLVEFEASLLEGAGAAMASETFRLMDPVSQAMMGVRADMTLQIARIAASRLKAEARPLRLSYAGDILRVRGSQLRPERQFVQVGGELIGAAGPAADTEVILMAVGALRDIGLDRLSVDLTFPTLISTLCRHLGIVGEPERNVRAALDSKDRQALAMALDEDRESRAVFLALLDATGPAGPGLALLEATALPAEARADIEHLADDADRLRAAAPAVSNITRVSALPSTATAAAARSAPADAILPAPASPTGRPNRPPGSHCSWTPSSATCRRRATPPCCMRPLTRRKKPSMPCAGTAGP